MFSDGVIEAVNEDGQQFGYDRFEDLIKSTGCNVEWSEFFDEILLKLKAFTGDVPWNDDVTIAVLDYKIDKD